jgi:flavodoxin I
MKALVVYDSLYGNTEKIAQAIANALASQADVRVVRVGDAKPEDLSGLDLLVAGTPTHGGRPSQPTNAWLKTLPANCLAGVKAAAFDTRVPVPEETPRIFARLATMLGYNAAPRLAAALAKQGGTLVAPAEGFNVKDTKGPLADGELEHAAAWAHSLAAQP